MKITVLSLTLRIPNRQCQCSLYLALLLAFSSLLCALCPLQAQENEEYAPREFNWSPITLSGREYVTAKSIAAFYEMEALFQGGLPSKSLTLSNPRQRLELVHNSRGIIVNEVSHWLSFPVLEREEGFLISKLDLIKTIEPSLRPNLIYNLEPIKAVVIDPGHGGKDMGAASVYGKEKDFTLDVAKKMRDILREQGVYVIMTRDDDVFVELEERARIANRTRNGILVSIHFNATNFNDEANGFEVFCLTPQGAPSTMDTTEFSPRFDRKAPGNQVDNASLALATCLHHSILAHMERKDRGVKRQRFAVLKLTKIPSVLLECGFLNNRAESRVVATEKWRQRLAYAIVQGLYDFKQMADSRQPPKTLADYLGTNRSRFRRRGDKLMLAPDQPLVLIPSQDQE